MKKTSLTLLILFTLFSATSHADDSLIDDAFDPFADYSDFVDASTEETDVNFFKFGRALSVSGTLGYRSFTSTQGELYSSNTFFGGSFTYYTSLQFAVQISYNTGTHKLGFDAKGLEPFRGSSTYSTLSLHGKYYINTQNLTKTVAKYNPFVIGGFSQISRDTSDSFQTIISASDSAASFDLGAGVEYLFNNNKNFISFKFIYYKADFANENRTIAPLNEAGVPVDTGLKLKGDPFSFQTSIGFNF